MRTRLMAFVAAFVAAAAFADTSITHNAIGYFVPDKRVRLEASVSDPKGVKLARAYFKTPAQADYIYVPMQATSGGRYAATLPAPNAAANSLEYLFLAVNNDNVVSKSVSYTVQARKTSETPAWQSAANQGDVKVYTELPNAPKTVAGFSDSVSMDVAESTARFGAVAGLYGAQSAGAVGSTAATSSGGTGTAASASATAGGLSTAAIVGGVAVAAAAAAAAGSGGGGGSSGGGGGTSFAGTYNGTQSSNININCGSFGSAVCTVTAPVTFNVNSSNVATGASGTANVSCNVSGFGSIAQAVAGQSIPPTQVGSNGVVNIPATSVSQSGATVNCSAGSITFNNSSFRVSGSQACTGTFVSPPESCSFNFTFSYN